jgi:DNA repair exonuclease SbcCD ATPase subunit
MQITILRTEQTQLRRSLEKERQRASESRQEYLAIKEELAIQEGRAKQLEEEIKELRARHKKELQEAAEHRELLEKVVGLLQELFFRKIVSTKVNDFITILLSLRRILA